MQVEEKAGIIDETNLSVQHHRVAIDSLHNLTFSNSSSISPSLSIVSLHDGKDQNTLPGVEFRNWATFSDPIRLELAGNARLIQEQTNQTKLWNSHGSISFDYGQDQLGPTLEVTGTYAEAPNDYSNLLNMSIIDGVGSSSRENTVYTRFQYGFSVCGNFCLVTPYAGFNFDSDGFNQSQLGARLSIGSLVNLDIERTQNPNTEVPTNQKIQFNSRFNW